MEKKMMVLAKILEHKDILFGVFSDTLTKQTKKDKWKEVYAVARKINIVSPHKDWTYIRDTFWQNCRKYTFVKIENSNKEGGKKCHLTPCDKIILDIVGRDSKLINGIGIQPEEHPEDFLENLASNKKSMPPAADDYASPAATPKTFPSRVKKAKKRGVGQLSLLTVKKKKLMLKRIELLNHKTILEIALLERQLGVPCSTYTTNLFDDTNNSNGEDYTKINEIEISYIKEENPVLNFNEN